mmetsp:Transcript_39391/g.104452  ORF Transcript_39391/g.104452 Transcript_39391/m.104452 type:complete len:775 (-) Transcript_39391:3-2327(-)
MQATEVRPAPEGVLSLLLSEVEINRNTVEAAEKVVRDCRVQLEGLQHVVGALSDSPTVMSVGSAEGAPGFAQNHSSEVTKRRVSPETEKRGGRPPSSARGKPNSNMKSNSTGAIKARVSDTSSQSHPQLASLLEPRETASEPAGVLKRQAVAASVGEEQMLVDEANQNLGRRLKAVEEQLRLVGPDGFAGIENLMTSLAHECRDCCLSDIAALDEKLENAHLQGFRGRSETVCESIEDMAFRLKVLENTCDPSGMSPSNLTALRTRVEAVENRVFVLDSQKREMEVLDALPTTPSGVSRLNTLEEDVVELKQRFRVLDSSRRRESSRSPSFPPTIEEESVSISAIEALEQRLTLDESTVLRLEKVEGHLNAVMDIKGLPELMKNLREEVMGIAQELGSQQEESRTLRSTCDVLTVDVAMAVEMSALAMGRCAQHEAKLLSFEHEAKMHEASVMSQCGGPTHVATKDSQHELGNSATSYASSTDVRRQQSDATILLVDPEHEGAVRRWTPSGLSTETCKGDYQDVVDIKTTRSLSPPSRRCILVEEGPSSCAKGKIMVTPRSGIRSSASWVAPASNESQGNVRLAQMGSQGMFVQKVSGAKLEEPDDTSSVRRVPPLKLGETLGRRHSSEALHRSNSPDFSGGRTSPQLSGTSLHRAVQSFSQSPSCGMALQYSQYSPRSLQVHVGNAFQRDAQVSERGACGEETAAQGVPPPHNNGLVACAGAPGTSTPVRVGPSVVPPHSARQSLHRSGAGSPTCSGRSLPAQLIRMPSSQQR